MKSEDGRAGGGGVVCYAISLRLHRRVAAGSLGVWFIFGGTDTEKNTVLSWETRLVRLSFKWWFSFLSKRQCFLDDGFKIYSSNVWEKRVKGNLSPGKILSYFLIEVLFYLVSRRVIGKYLTSRKKFSFKILFPAILDPKRKVRNNLMTFHRIFKASLLSRDPKKEFTIKDIILFLKRKFCYVEPWQNSSKRKYSNQRERSSAVKRWIFW